MEAKSIALKIWPNFSDSSSISLGYKSESKTPKIEKVLRGKTSMNNNDNVLTNTILSIISYISEDNETFAKKIDKKLLPEILTDSFVHSPPQRKDIVQLRIVNRKRRVHYIADEILLDPEDY